MGPSRIALLLAAAITACRPGSTSERAQPRRLAPIAWTATPPDAASDRLAEGLVTLWDRDTTTGTEILAPVRLQARFEQPVQVAAVKAFGLTRARLLATGRERKSHGDPSGIWERVAFDPQGAADTFDLEIVPLGPGARVAEIEVWGLGRAPAPRDPAVLVAVAEAAPVENLVRIAAAPERATLEVGAPHPCGVFVVRLDRNPRDVRRAFLIYRGAGLKRPIVLKRSLNGQPWVGGFWMGPTATARQVMDEVNPRVLEPSNHVRLCLPEDAAASVTVENLRLVAELDDGTNLLNRDSQAAAREAWDGLLSTSVGVRELELGLLGPTDLDRAWIAMDGHGARLVAAEVRLEGDWTRLAGDREVAPGTETLQASDAEAVRADAVRLRFAGGSRSDVPAAHLAEIGLAGSPVGRFGGSPEIVVTYPTDREHFGDRAFVAGFVDGELSRRGTVEVSIDGAAVSATPSFSRLLTRTGDPSAPWSVEIEARLADGSVVRKTVVLELDHRSELTADDSAPDGAQAEDALFGAVDEIASRLIGPEGGEVRLGERVKLVAPAGAVTGPTSLSVQRRAPTSVPRLDAGMLNVTAPAGTA